MIAGDPDDYLKVLQDWPRGLDAGRCRRAVRLVAHRFGPRQAGAAGPARRRHRRGPCAVHRGAVRATTQQLPGPRSAGRGRPSRAWRTAPTRSACTAATRWTNSTSGPRWSGWRSCSAVHGVTSEVRQSQLFRVGGTSAPSDPGCPPPPPRGQALRGHDGRVCLRPGVECSRHSGPRAGIQGWGGRAHQRPANAENQSTSGTLPRSPKTGLPACQGSPSHQD